MVDCDYEVKKRIAADPASADKYDSVVEMLRFNLDKVPLAFFLILLRCWTSVRLFVFPVCVRS